MFRKRRIFIILIGLLVCSLYAPKDTFGKPRIPSYDTKLNPENVPEIGGIAILKLTVIATFESIKDANIGCFLPEGIEFINDKNYKVNFGKYGTYSKEVSEMWGTRVIFYSGHMKKDEKKEFIFKIRIKDGRKYIIRAGSGIGLGDTLEIDLGDPEPPEWKPEIQERSGTIAGREYIRTSIKQLKGMAVTDLSIPQDSLPPLRTELQIRTKDRPYLAGYSTNPPGPIPFRYLVYTEKDFPKVEVSCILPAGFETVDASNYKTSSDAEGNIKVLLYSGPMRFKECKVFYFNVKVAKPLKIGERETISKIVKVETKVLTLENEILSKTDTQSLKFGRILF